MERKEVVSLLARYVILIILGIPNLYFFYLIFTPLTVYPTFFFLSLIDSSSYIVENAINTIFFKGYYASIIPACVAGAAYYLLLILNLTTPMRIKKRIWSITFLFGSFLFLNLIRILVFALIITKGGENYFNLAHAATWYFGSTAMVVLIWFSNILIFRIRTIPIYTDLKQIVQDIKSKADK